jgi:hypothetical protein
MAEGLSPPAAAVTVGENVAKKDVRKYMRQLRKERFCHWQDSDPENIWDIAVFVSPDGI